jgi:two-component system LytT family response regulator
MELLKLRQKRHHDLKDIMYFEADTNYTKIHFEGGKCTTESFTLKEVERALTANQYFYRVNRSCIVNIRFVKKANQSQVQLKNRLLLSVSRRRKENQQVWLMSFGVHLSLSAV